jgi:hypothetical protein
MVLGFFLGRKSGAENNQGSIIARKVFRERGAH